MPVVINEFEVVAAPPPPEERGPDEAKDGSDQREKPSLEQIFQRYHERAERVRAH